MKQVITYTIAMFCLVKFSIATTWTISVSGLTYTPDSITINFGDTVQFAIGGAHDAQEVSQATWQNNQSSPLAGGFYVPFGGGTLSGLTLGTHYYVCTSHAAAGMKGRIVVVPPVVIPNVWINEIHYDNAGADTLEGYEIAGPAGTNLACFRVFRYSGASGGIVYGTDTLTGVIPNQACGFGTVWFGFQSGGLQNATDGLVLAYDPIATGCGVVNADTVLQFLSYEGVFTPNSGRAIGLASTNIGVAESSSTLIGSSLQLGGVGTSYSTFTWQPASTATRGLVNTNQFFCGAPQATYSFRPTSITVSENAGTIVAGYVRGENVLLASQTVQVEIRSGNGNAADINNYTTQTFTFTPGGVDSLPFNLTITDDVVFEGTETIVFALRNPSANGAIGTDSLFTLTITDNDVPAPAVSFAVNAITVNEAAGSISLEVTMANANSSSTSVNVTLMSGGSATQGTDFNFTPATVTFPANSNTSQFVSVGIVDDNFVEGTESFQLMLSGVTNGGVIGTNDMVTVTINDNDTIPVGACSDLFFSEYIEGTSNNKAIEIYNPTPNAVNLSEYSVLRYTNGNTTPSVFGPRGVLQPGDVFVVANTQADSLIKLQADTLSGLMTFDGNDAIALIHFTDTLDVIGVIGQDPGSTGWAVDTATTKDRTLVRNYYTYGGNKDWAIARTTWKAYRVNMLDSLGAHHTAPCGSVEPGTIRFIQSSSTVNEDAGAVMVFIESVNNTGLPIEYTAVRNITTSTATALTDYTFSNRTFTNNGGTVTDTVYVNVIDDNLIESTETVVLNITAVTPNAIVADTVFTLNITDNDILAVSFNGTSSVVTEDVVTAYVKVIITSPVPTPTSVTVSQTSGSATANVDYFFNDTTITFAANSTDTILLPVAIVDDNIDESNEQINFNLLNPTNGAVLGISAYTLFIIDNDSTVGISNVEFDRSFQMYPNPAKTILNFSSRDIDYEVAINSVDGTVVHTAQYLVGTASCDISNLPAGMYFVHIRSGQNYTVRKFIKQE